MLVTSVWVQENCLPFSKRC